MCGIAGILGIHNVSLNVKNMLDAMHHRGPDDWGIYEDENTVLGHKRLSIIDLSAAGHQPMTNSEGDTTIVFNGEIYNYQELKALLPSTTKLKSTTDTEVILELWNLLDVDLLPKLRGMFALAIWNSKTKKLVFARDHMGIKPLYYQIKNNKLVFASEMKGMFASDLVEKRINENALQHYLANGYVMQPDTIIKDILMLPPASYLVWDGKQAQLKTYWNITDNPINMPKSENEAITRVKSILTEAVKEETISDRPLGVFLSGGLDSTILVAALRNSGFKKINTFSVGFEGDELSEENQAKETANFYETIHTQLQIDDKDIVSHIDQFIKSIDQPSIDGLNTWLISKITSKHVTVALSGLGGDELFSGYSIDKKILYKKRYEKISRLINFTKSIWKYGPDSITCKLKAYARWKDLPSFYRTWGEVFSDVEIKKIITNQSIPQNQFIPLNLSFKFSLLQRLSYMHQRGFMMSRLLRDSDAVSMDHSIEIRFPIIDYRLVNLTFNLPDVWKIKNVKATSKLKNYEKENSYETNGVKHILYQAFKNDLPPLFGARPKRGFKMPIEKWMRGCLLQDIENTILEEQEWLNKEQIKHIFDSWNKKEEFWMKVWSIYILLKWKKENQI